MNNTRTIYLYLKYDESDMEMKSLAQSVSGPSDQMMTATEHPLSFCLLDSIIEQLHQESIIIANDMGDIGIDKEDTAKRLLRMIRKHIVLLLISVPATYEHGTGSNANGIVLDTLRQVISQSESEVVRFRPRSVGRPKTEFPSGWDEKYTEWKMGRISSREFINWSGMKKATFYNRLTDYKRIKEQEEGEKKA